MKDHEVRELVDRLTSIAREFHATQQLRERISHVVNEAVRPKKTQQVEPVRHEGWCDSTGAWGWLTACDCGAEPKEPPVTGWRNGLCQDYNKELGTWFCDRLGARQELRLALSQEISHK